jgi:Malic enzyme, NAD binding domain
MIRPGVVRPSRAQRSYRLRDVVPPYSVPVGPRMMRCRKMAAASAPPVLLRLSKPTSNSDATSDDVLNWNTGRTPAPIGSPFDLVREANRGGAHRNSRRGRRIASCGGVSTVGVPSQRGARRLRPDLLRATRTNSQRLVAAREGPRFVRAALAMGGAARDARPNSFSGESESEAPASARTRPAVRLATAGG